MTAAAPGSRGALTGASRRPLRGPFVSSRRADGAPTLRAMSDFPDVSRTPPCWRSSMTRPPAGRPSRPCGACAPTRLELPWNAAEMRQRSLLAAWRLRARGLQPGDRLLTWSPSTPRLPALYWGAMRAGVVIVPLDLRMTPGVIDRISHRAETKWLVVDSGLDAPDPAEVGLIDFTVWKLEDLVADPDDSLPGRLAGPGRGLAAAGPRVALRDRLHLGHHRRPQGRHAQPRQHPRDGRGLRAAARAQAPPGRRHPAALAPLRAGARALLRHGHRRRGALRPLAEPAHHRRGHARAARHGHGHDAPGPGALLVATSTGRSSGTARRRASSAPGASPDACPTACDGVLFRSVHAQFGGQLDLFICAGAYLPPELQQAWEDMGIVVVQGYGSTECGIVTANDQWHHPPGVVGRCASRPSSSCIRDLGDPRPGPQRLGRLLAQRGGHGGLARRGGLVPDRRRGPLRRATATSSSRVACATSSSCPTA